VRIPVGITGALTGAALLGLMALAMLGFRAQEKDMESLRTSGQEIIYWSTSQGEAEFGRFLGALGRFSLGETEVTTAEVNRRFDILWSRVELFRQGAVGRRIQTYDTELMVIPQLSEILAKHENAIVNISHDDPVEVHQQILSDIVVAAEQLRKLSVLVLAGEETRLGDARDDVRSSAHLSWYFSMAALGLSMLLIGIMLVEIRRSRRMAAESAEVAARAEAASRAKSRFLTMMSHELRTPMNGVLGLLALARQTSLNERQLRLIEQAERSGRQMSGLLGDVLDYSDLQSETLVIATDMFELRRLTREVNENFGPVSERAGGKFTVEIADDAPRWVVGDMVRLRQMLGHFVTFLIDVVGSKDVRLVISRTEAGLIFGIDAAVKGSDQPGWQPEAMFGRVTTQYDDFASDALGPMIARGLVSLMGGNIELVRPVAGRATLLISAPLKLIDGPADCIRIEAVSITVKMVLGALLSKLGRAVWEPGIANQKVSAVLMEAGGEEEMVRAARLRSDHPAAKLVAIGTPRLAELFDLVCPQPVTADAIAAATATGMNIGADARPMAS
jgi:signal transduction histidine kinase